MNPVSADARPSFTPRQGQYLAFIHAYRCLHGLAPAEADIQRYFRVSPPSVHQMVLTLEKAGLIKVLDVNTGQVLAKRARGRISF